MTHFTLRTIGTCLTVAAAGCGQAVSPVNTTPAPAVRPEYNQADADFMVGMIHHHAQAVQMAKWVPTHEASDPLRRMAERIDVGQRDEIAIMTRWLVARGLPVPDSAGGHQHSMAGMDHGTHMPGMLTPDQMAQLDAARGAEFDRLFLTFMIQHHRGAVTMVDKLFGSQGATQDETVFRMASDIYADQTTEIDRMQKMLVALHTGEHSQ